MAADIDRIKTMESYLNECTEAVSGLSGKLDQMDAVREHMISLFDYYGSEDWFSDRESELPEGIPAGVLTEDSVYDTISEVRDTAIRMLELATDILKNRI